MLRPRNRSQNEDEACNDGKIPRQLVNNRKGKGYNHCNRIDNNCVFHVLIFSGSSSVNIPSNAQIISDIDNALRLIIGLLIIVAAAITAWVIYNFSPDLDYSLEVVDPLLIVVAAVFIVWAIYTISNPVYLGVAIIIIVTPFSIAHFIIKKYLIEKFEEWP
ncbi:hypothetical protein BFU36_09655 [Sulfolobus sp. A20]|uniref:hypothetical protein n=1 Tax=Sulfolobaceae TaxID=118883 RepID=UPI000845CBA6|nr:MULTISPECIES: hypothetical protein [unclassified Sulfolobus]TRM76881.1 hypothetical protein DJ532_06535 [Sulfolobus sp. A20-N-F8]TRM78248.1 hypothetical protein DJ528_05130 [Sulfolobus sp. B5]TRM84567.1 hypothetical protein DJ522_04235 [Sulfolobus sp. F3]TRM88169.1 hypothetical protein DJ529_06130 [Sulfolobus sp. C3]TRM88876.1 hypothetical protein DJ521_01065 [Sulfolobus sp. E3]TRM94900.1 hypothetical protein DJ526_01285 [Sulfolobus sp. A20-N-G8]TRN02103.1 hypothetical protein DJ527_04500